MKILISFITCLILTANISAQEFKVVFLIDKPYDKTSLNTMLESMNGLSLIGEDFVQFKMISNSENEVKLPHDNGDSGKKLKKSNVIGMAGVRCNPCKRLMDERKAKGATYVLTSDNDFGTCKLGVDDYEALSSSDDLMEIIKKERKKAKKVDGDYKVVFWIPSNQTVSVELLSDIETNKKVDFGTLVTFTASTNSKENIPVIMKVNDELVDACKDNGVAKINRNIPLNISHEITELTNVTLEGKGCGELKKITIDVSGKCDEIEKVIHEVTYNSKSKGPLGVKKTAQLEGISFSLLQLIDNKYYIVVINKQCGVREYRADFVERTTGRRFSFTLRKSQEQANVHLTASDRDNYSVFTLNHDDLKSKGFFEDVKDPSNSELTLEPAYNMTIVPVEAVKSSLELRGNESEPHLVRFQKCN